MNRRIVQVLELAGGGMVLLLECLHEVVRMTGDIREDETHVKCRTCRPARGDVRT